VISRLFFIGALRWEYKLSKFRNSEALSEYLTEERELALSYLCDELNCDRESLACAFTYQSILENDPEGEGWF